MMDYDLIREIGRGGMGCVYEATEKTSGQRVAVKMMSNQVTCYPEYRELFHSEAQALTTMNHPSVVHIQGKPFSDAQGNLYLPMEFVQGITLDNFIKKVGPMDESGAINVMCKILDAMQYVHDHGCIHRDIKPSNIIMRPDGSVCIIDFGIAKDARVGATGKTVGRIIGTDGYMSPEQATGMNIDIRTDIYSLGCLLYFLLTGKHAITSGNNNQATIHAILNANVIVPSTVAAGISKNTDQVFLKAIDKNMTHRYQSAAAFKSALTSCLLANKKVTIVCVGKNPDNDIVISNDYVSGRHLIIRGREQTSADGSQHPVIEIEDMSTNGTGLNGRLLRHAIEEIHYLNLSQLPQVMLSGLPECSLDWARVIALLKSRGWNPTLDEQAPEPAEPSDEPEEEKIDIMLGTLAFLLPFAGWTMYYLWKDETPRRADQAAISAWIGFIFYFMLIFLLIM